MCDWCNQSRCGDTAIESVLSRTLPAASRADVVALRNNAGAGSEAERRPVNTYGVPFCKAVETSAGGVMTWLLVGGAGYVGAHVADRLRADGRKVVIFDDLSSGFRHRVPADVPLVQASCTDSAALLRAMEDHHASGVIFLAGRKSVPDSVAHPLSYYRANVEALRVVLEAMEVAGVRRMLLSSSASVYGHPIGGGRIPETAATVPINPYGETKLVNEWLVRSVGVAHGLSWIALRYFNVVGAASPQLADDPANSNLLSIVLRCASENRPVQVTGADYKTRDGTAVRDFVHAADVADAHLRAVARLEREPSAEVYNVGTGRGHSVLEVVEQVQAVVGTPIERHFVGRRPGDAAEVVASVDKIAAELEWRSRHSLADMVHSAWQGFRHSDELRHARVAIERQTGDPTNDS